MTHADPVSITIIVTCYFVFAMQIGIQAGADLWRTRGARAVLALVVVFVFCALAGYATDILAVPYWIREGLHILLALASLWLVLTNQARAVAAMLRHDRG